MVFCPSFDADMADTLVVIIGEETVKALSRYCTYDPSERDDKHKRGTSATSNQWGRSKPCRGPALLGSPGLVQNLQLILGRITDALSRN